MSSVSKSRPEKILNRDFVFLCLISVFSTVPQIASAILSLYAQSLGASLSIAGVLAGMTSIISLCVTPISGPLANRIDRRILMMISLAVTAVSNIGFGLADSIGAAIFWRLVYGIGWGVSAAASLVMVTETLPTDKVARGIGYFGMIQIIISAVGPALVLALANRSGYPVVFFIMAACALTALVFAFFLPSSLSGREDGKSLKRLRLNEIFAPESMVPAVIGGLFAFVNGVQLSYVLSYAVFKGFENVGFYFTFQAAATVLSRIVLGRIYDTRTLLFPATFAGTLLLAFSLIIGFGDTLWLMYLSGVLFGVGYGSLIPVCQAVSIGRVPAGRKGSGSSTYTFFVNIGIGGGGLLGGLIADYFGYVVLFLFLILPILSAWILALIKGRFPISPEAYEKHREQSRRSPAKAQSGVN